MEASSWLSRTLSASATAKAVPSAGLARPDSKRIIVPRPRPAAAASFPESQPLPFRNYRRCKGG